MPNSSKRSWSRNDMLHLISSLESSSDEQLHLVVQDYIELFDPVSQKLKPTFHYLIFGTSMSEALSMSNRLLTLLIGEAWISYRDLYYAGVGKVLDKDNFMIDLSDVEPRYALSKFNVLSHYQGIQVPSVSSTKPHEIPPAINLAIALSIRACQMGRGLFLWQRKSLTSNSTNTKWTVVPDLLLLDYPWQPEEQKSFANASYTDRRDYLCANLRLSSHDVVLPFLLHFRGYTLADDEDAVFIIPTDNTNLPKASISIPGAAFIGWQAQATQPAANEMTSNGDFLSSGKKIKLTATVREATRVTDVTEMYYRAMGMFDAPIDDSLMLYNHVREMAEVVRLAKGK